MAIIVATSFWALVWGLVGLIIATPLTVCLVVIGRHVERLSFFAVILGDASPLLPSETFYQRALEGRSATLEQAARAQTDTGARAEYYDRVVLLGLAQAQRDRVRGVLTYDRLEAVHAQVEALIARLAPAMPDAADTPPGAVPPGWEAEGAILCVPGRGQLDDLAAEMAVQTMREAGFGVRSVPNAMLDAAAEPDFDISGVKLCCLSVLEDGATAAGIQFFVRRIQRKIPGCMAVVGLWQAAGDSPLLAALRAEGRDEHLVLSIGELAAFVKPFPPNANRPAARPWSAILSDDLRMKSDRRTDMLVPLAALLLVAGVLRVFSMCGQTAPCSMPWPRATRGSSPRSVCYPP